MCLLTYTTYQCVHTDWILTRFCRIYAVTQRRSQCQDTRIMQAFIKYTDHTHSVSRLIFDAGGSFRNHAVCHHYVLTYHFLGYCDAECLLLILCMIREVQSCSSSHGRLQQNCIQVCEGLNRLKGDLALPGIRGGTAKGQAGRGRLSIN